MARPHPPLGHPNQPAHFPPIAHGASQHSVSAGYHPMARCSSISSYGSGELVTQPSAHDGGGGGGGFGGGGGGGGGGGPSASRPRSYEAYDLLHGRDARGAAYQAAGGYVPPELRHHDSREGLAMMQARVRVRVRGGARARLRARARVRVRVRVSVRLTRRSTHPIPNQALHSRSHSASQEGIDSAASATPQLQQAHRGHSGRMGHGMAGSPGGARTLTLTLTPTRP